MEYKIIVDSCCDITPQLAERLCAASVPMTLRLGKKEYVDDAALDLPEFMTQMKDCTEKVGTSSPTPFSYMEAMESARRSFVVATSSQLSSSYANAELGRSLVEENGTADVHVFDSKSASAGQTLIALKIRELISNGIPKDQIIHSINSFIQEMKTYFVLERYDNLIKNGRLSKIVGKIIDALNIKLIMGSDGNGNIALHAKLRGTKQMIQKLMSFIQDREKPTSGETIVISHCNNLPLVGQIIDAIKRQFDFKEIVVVPTRGVASLYADDKGVVLAF